MELYDIDIVVDSKEGFNELHELSESSLPGIRREEEMTSVAGRPQYYDNDRQTLKTRSQ